MPLVHQVTLQEFEKWVVDFVEPIHPPRKRTSARYIIIATYYLNRWAEEARVKDCTTTATAKFLFDNVVTSFECINILISNQGMDFVNHLIEELTQEFQIQHRKTTTYHSQVNGVFEEFNKILENALENICNVQRDDWDHKIYVVLWAYRTTCKKWT